VHRGGGFTKDHLYLSGLERVYKFVNNNGNLNTLLTGKVSLEYINTIIKLQEMGLAVESKYVTDSYRSNNSVNKNLDFILKSLK